MSPFRFILASLRHHWRMNLAVGVGVAVGTAVLTGALVVGDSMRGSLRDLTLGRLGPVDNALVADRFFRAALADELAAEPDFKKHFAWAAPAILLRASLENPSAEPVRRVNRVNLIGGDSRFWWDGLRFRDGEKRNALPEIPVPAGRQIVLNRETADALGAEVGDTVILRLPLPGLIPAESPLGRSEGTIQSQRLAVKAIVPNVGLGCFSLRPDQRTPQNAYVALGWLQSRLDRPERANAILVAGRNPTRPMPGGDRLLQQLLRPRLADYGLRAERTSRRYVNLTSQRMLLSPPAETSLLNALDGATVQPALTYLANTIARGEREIPYSTITAVDFAKEPPLGPMVDTSGKPLATPADDEIVLNAWAAEQLQAKPKDRIRVTFFEPESTDGQVRERTVELVLSAVASMRDAAADPSLTPEVAGVTDQTSMEDWNPPFPFDARRIRSEDETYWDNHRATPKAFVSLATGRKLWASRFGRTTSLRVVPNERMDVERIRALALPPATLGLRFQPVKEQGLAAAAGTTSFSALFLAFSFFLIAAAVMLVGLLFRLGLDTRPRELGILAAVGFRRRRIEWLLGVEGAVVAVLGSLVGVIAGVGYASLMLLGLETSWLAAIVTPFLQLHVAPESLVLGAVAGLMVALATIVFVSHRAGRLGPSMLLAGRMEKEPRGSETFRHGDRWIWVVVVLAIVLALVSGRIGEEIRAGAFFGIGALALAAAMVLCWRRLARGATGPAVVVGAGGLLRLALRNAARNPGRSTLCVGLVASSCFLIVAVSAFRLDPTAVTPSLDSGNGGFALIAGSDQPIYHDPGTQAGRRELGFGSDDMKLLDRTNLFSLRVHEGDDATCLNLYRPRQPRMLGLPEAMRKRGGFAWAGVIGDASLEERNNPWLLLERTLSDDADGTPRAPVVLEKNTANYILHLWGGPGQTYDVVDQQGRKFRLVMVALLSGSIFQGDLLLGEQDLLKHFPETGGYRAFLVEAPEEKTAAVQAALERALGDYGFDAETTGRRLASLYAVQNTYLSTFQSLGGLGLLLGTVGLAVVQIRNVLERRGELALLRAVGFGRHRLARLVLLEHAVLLIAGLGAGLASALVAILPHLIHGTATIPWLSLAGVLALILCFGLAAGLGAVRAAVTAPLLGTLREEC